MGRHHCSRETAAVTVPHPGRSMSFPLDTSRDALKAQFAALRLLAPERRLELMDDLTRMARSWTLAGIRRRNPGSSEAEVERLFFEIALGRDLAERVLEHRRSRLAMP